MQPDNEKSLSDEATFAGRLKPPTASRDVSLGDERTLGDAVSGQDTILEDIEVVDLEARYRIDGTLGQGGMGAVLLATDTRLDRKVAIKRILGEAAGNRMAVNRFLTEAKSIAALNHPNIVQIYDYGRAKDGPFLIMEFVDGGSLLDRCRGTAIPLEEAIDLACQLCDGLGKAHGLGIIHRDIKPANILLTKEGTPKLTDFGLAKAQADDHGQTMTGAVLGTPDFMPPEQRKDASLVDARSDLWSLAATVYQMVTGRTPKIIRFKDVPESLQDVLGKALEDEKNSRYQSARELRDAIRSSLRDSGAAETSLGEGQCPGCGTKNDSSRRFCRSCGGSLEVPCLSCAKPMPIWEEICGQCGNKQQPLIEERRSAMAVRQSAAESSLTEFDFEAAMGIAISLKEEPDPRLRQLAGWAEAFLPEIDKKREEQLALAARSLSEALRHEKAFDYSSGIHALELVPEILHTRQLPGQQETVAAALARLSATQTESERLDRLIKARIAGRELTGLLTEVQKLLVVRPDRQDVQKLKKQLEERQAKLVRQRDEVLAKAQNAMASHSYQEAAALLAAIDTSVSTPEVESLATEADMLRGHVQDLVIRIKTAVAEKRYDGLLESVDKLLHLAPQDQEAQKLRQSLIAWEMKRAAEVAAIESQADAAWKALQFSQAAKLIDRIPEARRSVTASSLHEACVKMSMAQSTAVNSLKSLPPDADFLAYGAAIGHAQDYQSQLERWSLMDKGLDESLPRYIQIRDSLYEQEEKQRGRRTLGILISGLVGLAVVATAATAGGLWARFAYRASQVAAAISQQRWDDALAIEPDNAAALVGRAQAKLVAIPANIDGAFSDLDRAERQPEAAALVQPARAAAHAARAVEQAQEDRLDRAAEDLRAAEAGGAAAAILSRAQEAITKGWLVRGEQAVANVDAAAVRSASDSAMAAGAGAVVVAPLRARGLVLEALALQSKGDLNEAVSAILAAALLDASHVQTMLDQPPYASLRKGVVAQYRDRFDAAVTRKDWQEAVRMAAAVQPLDKASYAWVSQAVAGFPPAALASLPPAALASLPPAALAVLPPLRNSVGMAVKLLPAGTFSMGQQRPPAAPPGPSDEAPHDVTLTKPFYIGVYEVTNAEWKRVMGSVPSSRKEDNHPVEQVSWSDAVEFCSKLSALQEERAAGREYRLPTEAEWEYACRAGTTTTFSFGDDEQQLEAYGWFKRNSFKQIIREYEDKGESRTSPVGMKTANAWGLYDMHGNVREHCSDLYGWGKTHVSRGGSWLDSPNDCRSSSRFSDKKDMRNGFRIAMSLFGPGSPTGVSDD